MPEMPAPLSEDTPMFGTPAECIGARQFVVECGYCEDGGKPMQSLQIGTNVIMWVSGEVIRQVCGHKAYIVHRSSEAAYIASRKRHFEPPSHPYHFVICEKQGYFLD